LLAPYCASKAGVLGLTKAMAAELAPKVTVNAVCPGPVATPMMEAEIAWFDDPDLARQESIDRVPMRRWATPDEVAAAVLFLVTDAPYATGSAISLDGGTTAI
jgi:NAD(P)-dependent dehydrogenase (short-subunit alcohol dehydrogenase family)